jgi:hypothetical protein
VTSYGAIGACGAQVSKSAKAGVASVECYRRKSKAGSLIDCLRQLKRLRGEPAGLHTQCPGSSTSPRRSKSPPCRKQRDKGRATAGIRIERNGWDGPPGPARLRVDSVWRAHAGYKMVALGKDSELPSQVFLWIRDSFALSPVIHKTEGWKAVNPPPVTGLPLRRRFRQSKKAANY